MVSGPANTTRFPFGVHLAAEIRMLANVGMAARALLQTCTMAGARTLALVLSVLSNDWHMRLSMRLSRGGCGQGCSFYAAPGLVRGSCRFGMLGPCRLCGGSGVRGGTHCIPSFHWFWLRWGRGIGRKSGCSGPSQC